MKNQKLFDYLVLSLAAIYFFLRAIFAANLLYVANPPDYGHHLVLAKFFSYHPRVLIFSNYVFPSGCVGQRFAQFLLFEPSLYYSLVGKIWFFLRLLGFSNSEYLINIIQSAFGFLTIIFIYKFIGLLTKSIGQKLFGLIILLSIPMFNFLSFYLHYDNLVNLAAAGFFYYGISFLFFKKDSVKNLLFFFIFSLIGLLSKRSFYPLFLVIMFPILIRFINFYLLEKVKFLKSFLKLNLLPLYLILGFLLVIAGNYYLNHYYRRFDNKKSPLQLWEEKGLICEDNGVAGTVHNPLVFSENTEYNLVSKPIFLIKFLNQLEKTSFDISSHKSLFKSNGYHKILKLLIVLELIFFILNLINNYDKKKVFVLLIILAYAYLLAYFSYTYFYFRTHDIALGIQGRYLFIILTPLVYFFVNGFWEIFASKLVKLIIFVSIAIFFIYFDFIFYLNNYRLWYFPTPHPAIQKKDQPLFFGQCSVFQKFYYVNQKGIALYLSTYLKKIPKKSVVLKIFDKDCQNKILELNNNERILDNDYLYFSPINLPIYNYYCFSICNNYSEPIAYWFAEKNLPGQAVNQNLDDLKVDLLYYLIFPELDRKIKNIFIF